MAAIFRETAMNEQQHAKLWFVALKHLGHTPENLAAAKGGEHYEWTQMYKEYEQVAREEGFTDIADAFREVAEVEEEHEKRFTALINNLENKQVFSRPEPRRWQCRNCGYIHEGTEAPLVCPACKYPQGYYQLMMDNY